MCTKLLHLWLVGLLAAGLALTGCDDDPNACDPACDEDDCEVCEDGECVVTCDDDEVCDGDGECVPEIECENDSDCDEDACEECDRDGMCVTTCDDDEVCDGDGECVDPDDICDPECDADACEVCDGGECVSECDEGETCDDGDCIVQLCDPLYNEGCADDERCGFYRRDEPLPRVGCLPEDADAPGPGDECSLAEDAIYGIYGNCQGGSICIPVDIVGSDYVFECYALCSDEDATTCSGVYDGSDGTCSLGLFLEDPEGAEGIAACAPTADCDPFCQTGCDADELCLPSGDSAGNVGYSCADQARGEDLPGDGFAYDTCNRYINECAPGFVCLSYGGVSQCIKTCDTEAEPPEDDADFDGVTDDDDNCPEIPNADQTDTDDDDEGDACDDDLDGDDTDNDEDNCPYALNEDQADEDDDGVGDVCQGDQDSDGICDGDEDIEEMCEAGPDNCMMVPNEDQADEDEDETGDACDEDFGGDECEFVFCGTHSSENGDEVCAPVTAANGFYGWEEAHTGLCVSPDEG